jgi:hypothetical protein
MTRIIYHFLLRLSRTAAEKKHLLPPFFKSPFRGFFRLYYILFQLLSSSFLPLKPSPSNPNLRFWLLFNPPQTFAHSLLYLRKHSFSFSRHFSNTFFQIWENANVPPSSDNPAPTAHLRSLPIFAQFGNN